jgi:hypothetical protein
MKRIFDLLSSAKLAMALLVAILICCFIGAAVIRPEEAGGKVFNTLWFNALLVLLVVNVAFCFFGRVWGRKVTVVSFGMILFHLSFVFVLLGIIYNSFFYFRGEIRLTEGETLPSGDLQSCDYAERGRFFNLSWLKGETALHKVFREYTVDEANKRWTYEISVGDNRSRKQKVIYITNPLDHGGFGYYNDREGYSILTLLYDKRGKELYGAHVPLQSLKQKDDTFLYTTGSRIAPGTLLFPHDPGKPLYRLQVIYTESKDKERLGTVTFKLWPPKSADMKQEEKPSWEVTGPVGSQLRAGDYYLKAAEVRYWAVMTVRFEPGKPVVLASLWVGLSGMIITFIGRMQRRRNQENFS